MKRPIWRLIKRDLITVLITSIIYAEEPISSQKEMFRLRFPLTVAKPLLKNSSSLISKYLA